MPSEQTVLRISPAIITDEPTGGSPVSASTSVKVYRSCQDAFEQSRNTPPDRQLVVVIDIKENHGSDQSKPSSTTGSNVLTHDDFQASSRPLHDNDKLTQQLIRWVFLEFHRVNQEVTVNRHIDSFNQRLQSLSTRELDVLILIVQGRTCKEMASKLAVGLATVAKHRAKLFKKLGIRNCIELMHLLSSLFNHKLPDPEGGQPSQSSSRTAFHMSHVPS